MILSDLISFNFTHKKRTLKAKSAILKKAVYVTKPPFEIIVLSMNCHCCQHQEGTFPGLYQWLLQV